MARSWPRSWLSRLDLPALGRPIALDGFGYIAPQSTRRDLLGVEQGHTVQGVAFAQGNLEHVEDYRVGEDRFLLRPVGRDALAEDRAGPEDELR